MSTGLEETLALAGRAIEEDERDEWIDHLRRLLQRLEAIRDKLSVDDLFGVVRHVVEVSCEFAESGAGPDWPDQAVACGIADLLDTLE